MRPFARFLDHSVAPMQPCKWIELTRDLFGFAGLSVCSLRHKWRMSALNLARTETETSIADMLGVPWVMTFFHHHAREIACTCSSCTCLLRNQLRPRAIRSILLRSCALQFDSLLNICLDCITIWLDCQACKWNKMCTLHGAANIATVLMLTPRE